MFTLSNPKPKKTERTFKPLPKNKTTTKTLNPSNLNYMAENLRLSESFYSAESKNCVQFEFLTMNNVKVNKNIMTIAVVWFHC